MFHQFVHTSAAFLSGLLRCNGVGLSDSEVIEHLWSCTRQFNRMTKQKKWDQFIRCPCFGISEMRNSVSISYFMYNVKEKHHLHWWNSPDREYKEAQWIFSKERMNNIVEEIWTLSSKIQFLLKLKCIQIESYNYWSYWVDLKINFIYKKKMLFTRYETKNMHGDHNV